MAGHPTEPFPRRWLRDLVSPQVLDELPESTALDHVVERCQAVGAFDESYRISISTIKNNWHQFTPETRRALIRAIEQHGCQEGFDDAKLKLSASDEEALRIRWDIADIFFADARAKAFARCKEYGLEMELPRGMPQSTSYKDAVSKGQEILLALLREKTEIDAAVVIVAVGPEAARYRGLRQERWGRSYFDVLEAFRGALCNWLEQYAPLLRDDEGKFIFNGVWRTEDLTFDQKQILGLNAEQQLEPFKTECKGLLGTVVSVQPSASVFEKIRRNIEEPGGIYMSNVHIFNNIENSTIVNESKVKRSFNRVDRRDPEAARALIGLAEIVARSGRREGGELLDAFNEELEKETPRKSMLASTWAGLTKAVPAIIAAVDIVEKVTKLFTE